VNDRPDPDQLLAQVQAQEAKAHRGRLRVFFGSSAGVGKTYAMLEAARNAVASGTEVVVGYVEPHGRYETERLTEGLERLPLLEVRYRDIVRRELDLDAALRRKPAILLVDELRMCWAQTRRRVIPSAGRMSKSCSKRASRCGRR
jgi:two-component system sensor histidine kinase KdpD